MNRRVLDPLERTSEILFGLIMVLTFTGSLRVAEGAREDLRTVLAGAIGCNLAWGIVDAAMYLMAAFMTRARGLAIVSAVRDHREPEAARQLIAELLPSPLAAALTPADIEQLRQRLDRQALRSSDVRLTPIDFLGALGVFLLVFVSTFPVVVPLIVVRDTKLALAWSNAVALAMLFVAGWSLGRHAGRPGWRSGLGVVIVGILLVAITVALGG